MELTKEYFEQRKKEMLELRFEHNWRIKDIGNRYGISRERVRQIIGNTGASRGGMNVSANTNTLRNQEWLERTCGLSDQEIALLPEVNASTGTITYYRKNHFRKMGKKPHCSHYEGVKLLSEEMTTRGIANICMPYKCGHDIFAPYSNLKIKVCVAYTQSSSPSVISKTTAPMWRFYPRFSDEDNVDVVVFIILKLKEFFILPSSEFSGLKHQRRICITYPRIRNGMISQYAQYHNRFDLIGGKHEEDGETISK